MERILRQQKNEITEYHIYTRLARLCKDEGNRKTLLEIGEQEREHYAFWSDITGQETPPDKWKIRTYLFLARIFGLSFALRLMEKGESDAGAFYDRIEATYPRASHMRKDEEDHEQKLIGLLNDSRLIYAGSIVLGLNDALVEFTGTLAGLTFAFNNNLLVGTTGLVMGFAASLSMAASGYLASREEEDHNEAINPVTAALYTGFSYIGTVALLVLPYLLQNNPYMALTAMLSLTVLIIAGYTYYVAVAKELSFKRRFLEMAAISLGVALISFGVGTVIKHVFGVDI